MQLLRQTFTNWSGGRMPLPAITYHHWALTMGAVRCLRKRLFDRLTWRTFLRRIPLYAKMRMAIILSLVLMGWFQQQKERIAPEEHLKI